MMAGLIRPEARAAMWRWREICAAGALGGAGLWLLAQGGWLLVPLGAAVLVLALGWGVIALRRMRFVQSGFAPGVVEVLEGQVSYYGPAFGGSVSLAEVDELRLLTSGGRRMWRLRQADGQLLLIPVEAVGAEALFDAFSGLAGLDTQALVEAVRGGATSAGVGQGLRVASLPDSRVIWRRPARAVLT